MESLYSSVIIFSGVTITLLGAFLLASERQLRKKQRELDEFKRETASSSELATRNAELAKEISSLASQLEDKQRRLDEYRNQQHRLLSVQSDNQKLGETIDSLRNQLETSETQLGQSARRIQEADDHRAALESEQQALRGENQRLQEEIVRFHAQLQTNEERFNATSAQHNAIAEQHAQLQADFADSKRHAEELAEKNNELLEEVGRLSTKLTASEKSFEELRTIQENSRLENQQVLETNQRLQREIADLHRLLTTAQSQLDEYAERNEKLQTETGELKQELEQRQASIDELRNAERRHAEIQSESQGLRQQNQVLQQELEKHRVQVNASETRLQRADNQNQELSDRCAYLETEAADWKQRLEDSQSKVRELETVQQQLANVESREMVYREQQQKFEARIVDLERELAEAKNHKASQETERLCQELADENRRLMNSVGSDETRDDQTDHESRGSAPSTHLAKDAKAGPPVKRTGRFRAVAAVVVVLIASAVFVGFLGSHFSTSNEPVSAPEISPNEFAADEDPKPQTKPEPPLRGTFQTIRSTQVYGGPSENAPLIAKIGPRMKLSVVGSSDGWLEIRSKHGRPPGFIRQEAAVRIGQN